MGSRLGTLSIGVCTAGLLLAACGGSPASAPASSPPLSPALSAKPAAASAVTKPAAASVGAAASAKPGASGLTKVKLAYSQVSAAATPIYVAADQGFFQKHGLDVSIGQVAGPQQVPALTSGELQFGTPGGNEVVDADLSGASLVMIATASDVPLFSLNADKSITDPKQLAGKSVAITTAGSSTEAAAKLFLTHFGLEKQVKLQPAGQIPAVLATLEKGNVAGGILSPPSTYIAADQGFPELINGPKLGQEMVHASVAVTRDYLKAHPDIIKEFLQGYQDAWTFCASPANEAAVEKTLVKWTKANDKVAQESYKYIAPVWSSQKTPTIDPKAVSNILNIVTTNPKAKGAKPEQFFDNSLLTAIAK